METIREQLSSRYRFLDLEDFFWGDHEGMMSLLKEALARNENIILYHQENINFYHVEYNGVPWIKTIQMTELKNLVNDHRDRICVLAHGVHDNFPFEYINHYDFWIDIRNRNNGIKFPNTEKKKEKDFLFLMRRQTEHRHRLREKLQKRGCLENSLYAYIDGEESIHLPPEYEHEKFNDPKFKLDKCYYEPAIWQVLPQQYDATKWSIVAETVETNDIHCLSEKIFKPLIGGHLFVVLAGAGYLSYLRAVGFKTFGDYIDESYDNEPDIELRIDKIVDLCVDLKQKDHKDLQGKIQGIIKHNRELFFDDSHLESLNTHIINKINKYFKR
jgi:hypothetical protein